MNRFLCLLTVLMTLAACSPRERDAAPAGILPYIWPDYVGVTVPATIAPLDFTLDGADALDVRLTAPDGTSLRSGGKPPPASPGRVGRSCCMPVSAIPSP